MKRKIRFIAGIAVSLICMLSAACFAEEPKEIIRSGEWEYVRNADGTVTITGWSGEEKKLSIPAELDAQQVTGIGDAAFYACTELTEVTIPDCVTEIGEHAFDSCVSLKSITLPDSVAEIDDCAFQFCDCLSDVTIPSFVTRIGDKSFCACNALERITIPDSLTEIGNWAFGTCDSLTGIEVSPGNDIYIVIDDALVEKKTMTLVYYPCGLAKGACVIPDGIVKIGDRAFMDCAGLTDITIPDSVVEIGNYAFSFCHGLTDVEIPSSVKKIGEFAFSDCSNLTSVRIPDSATEIGKDAFYGNKKLTLDDQLLEKVE